MWDNFPLAVERARRLDGFSGKIRDTVSRNATHGQRSETCATQQAEQGRQKS
jgi:hypothetical protein